MNFMIDYNKKVNLTSITLPEEIVVKHFADSVSVLLCELGKDIFKKEHNVKIIDVGSGAGFPGVPIKILFPNIHLTLLDSSGKRIEFLKLLIQNLNLCDVLCVKARAEEFSKIYMHREKYDLCVSRAVSNLTILSELCLPFVKLNGFFIAYKGHDIFDEITNANKIIKKLGGVLYESQDIKLKLDNSTINHTLIFIKKIVHTPKCFPNNYKQILYNYNVSNKNS
jgi:16S rRNA (guanine527-N7)-methyltransferase